MSRIILIFLLLCIPTLSQSAEDIDERRIEEQKRIDLKSTESQYFDASKTDVKDGSDRMDYFEYLSQKKRANFNDVVYVVCLLSGQSANLTDFESQQSYLIENKLLPRSAKKYTQESLVSRGTLAYMIMRILDIKGGLTLQFFRTSKRYAHKELVYRGLMISGSNREHLTGKELVYSFVQAANYGPKEN